MMTRRATSRHGIGCSGRAAKGRSSLGRPPLRCDVVIMRRFAVLALLTVLASASVACGSDESAPAETGSASTTTVTTPGPTTVPATPATSAAPTADTTAPTGEPCEPPTETDPVSVDFPSGMSSLVGREIRTGAHPCFERVVLELQGAGEMPGYRVGYVADPVKLSPSDIEVDIAGDATLVLSVAAWMTTMEGEGYDGPDQILPTNVELVEELRLIENFEGMHQWAIGLDRVRPFSVTTLDAPPRIVIDIAS